jgi:hypothetical protein
MTDLYLRPRTPQTTTCTVSRASRIIGELINQTFIVRDRIVITFHGNPRAVLINPLELAELEAALALAEGRLRELETGVCADVRESAEVDWLCADCRTSGFRDSTSEPENSDAPRGAVS